MLIKNIGQLITGNQGLVKGAAMNALPVINNAWLYIKNGIIDSYGSADAVPPLPHDDEQMDATGRIVMPCFCDPHSHIVFSGSREGEFTDRIRGLSYQDIAARGGGIISSVKNLRATSEDALYDAAMNRIEEMISTGTGALEIKSGYGLDAENELKMLRVIARLKRDSGMLIKATFLGAHAIPPEYKTSRRNYIDMLIGDMIPQVGNEKLADFCDVFCEENYFTQAETEEILNAASAYGIKPKVHANQLSKSGGVQAGVNVKAVSVDHLEYVEKEEIDLLMGSSVVPTILPGAQFFLQLKPPPARQMIDSGLGIAIGSDYNPGSCPSGNMLLMIALACIIYKMTPEESINAATINAAAAMLEDRNVGSISPGKAANVIITRNIPSLAYIPYAFGSSPLEKVIINGKVRYTA
jgi:imidazolonepropionase